MSNILLLKFLFLFSFFSSSNDLKQMEIKHNPVAIQKRIFSYDYKQGKTTPSLVSQMFYLFDEKGMIVYSFVKKFKMEKDSKTITKEANIFINSYNSNNKISKSIRIFGKPLTYETIEYTYLDNEELQKKVIKNSKDKVLKEVLYTYSGGLLAQEIIKQFPNKKTSKIMSYTYDDTFKVNLVKEGILDNASDTPTFIYKTSYKYLRKENNFIYNREIKKYDVKSNKILDNHRESLLKKNRFLLKYVFNKNGRIASKYKLDIDRYENIINISFFKDDRLKSETKIDYYYAKRKEEALNVKGQYLEEADVIGPKDEESAIKKLKLKLN